MAKHFLSDGRARLGRPPGPSRARGERPWDMFSERILRFVHANPDMARYAIAEQFGLSPSQLSNITCSPRGESFLRRLRELDESRPS